MLLADTIKTHRTACTALAQVNIHHDVDMDLASVRPPFDRFNIDLADSDHTVCVPFVLTETICVAAVQTENIQSVDMDLDAMVQGLRDYITKNQLVITQNAAKSEGIPTGTQTIGPSYCIIHWQIVKHEERVLDESQQQMAVLTVHGEASWGGGN